MIAHGRNNRFGSTTYRAVLHTGTVPKSSVAGGEGVPTMILGGAIANGETVVVFTPHGQNMAKTIKRGRI